MTSRRGDSLKSKTPNTSALLVLIVLGLALTVPPSRRADAQSPTKIRLWYTSAVITSASAVTSVAKGLGYFAEEGLDVQLGGIGGGSMGGQQLIAGNVDVIAADPEVAAIANEKEPTANIRLFYRLYPNHHKFLEVLEDSPIKSVRDMKGAKIGVSTLASSLVPFSKSVVAQVLDPERDITFIAVGIGAQAGQALRSKQIDVHASWDEETATLENFGLKFRRFYSPIQDQLFGTSLMARDEWLTKNQKIAAGIGRAIAKGTVFTMANPEAAIRIHWKLFPDSAPKGISQDEGLKQQLHVLQARIATLDINRKPGGDK